MKLLKGSKFNIYANLKMNRKRVDEGSDLESDLCLNVKKGK